MTSRIHWIDIAKGFGILAVIYAHTLSADSFRYLFYSFHMPLFFFLSGVVFHYKKNKNFLPIIQKNIKRIFIPYLIFAVISYLLWYFTLSNYTPSLIDVKKHLFGILYGNNRENIMFYNGVLWFLPCLFITKILFSSFIKISSKSRFLLIFLLVSSLIGYILSIIYPKEKLVFGLETAFTAVVFFGGGYLWNTKQQELQTFFKKKATSLFFIFAICCLLFATFHYHQTGYQVDLRLNKLGNYFLFYLASISGILATIALSINLEKNKILEYLGSKSLVLFVWHLLIFAYLNLYFFPHLNKQFLSNIKGPIFSLLITFSAIVIILILDILYLRIRKEFSKSLL